MQRRFGGDFCPQKTKIHPSKTLIKSIVSGQNKNFFKILKKSVAKIVRLFYAICIERKMKNEEKTSSKSSARRAQYG